MTWGREEDRRRALRARGYGGEYGPGIYLSSQPVIDVTVYDDEESDDPMAETKAHDDGQKLGQAFAVVVGSGPVVDIRAATELGKWFAKQGGYQALEPGLEFVGGFIQGLQDGGRQIAQIPGPTSDAG